ACRNPRRTSCKLAAEENWPQRTYLRRANALRGRWRRAAPTNGLVVAVRSSTLAAVQPPPHLSRPSSGESFPADDTVRLRKIFRLLFLLFEQPLRPKLSRLQAGRGSRRQKQFGTDRVGDVPVKSCVGPPP